MEPQTKIKRVRTSTVKAKAATKSKAAPKSKVNRVRSYRFKTNSNPITKKRFQLYGTVEKIARNGSAVLVLRGGSSSSFWLDIPEGMADKLAIDAKCRFDITASTFWGKDKTLRTKLRVVEFNHLDDEDQLELGFCDGYGTMPAKIVSSLSTDIPGLYVLTIKRMEEGEEKETYQMRYFTKTRIHPQVGTAIIKFNLFKVKDVIDEEGVTWIDNKTSVYVDENGEEREVESPIYTTSLGVTEIIKG